MIRVKEDEELVAKLKDENLVNAKARDEKVRELKYRKAAEVIEREKEKTEKF